MGQRLNVWVVSCLSWSQQGGFGLDGIKGDRLKGCKIRLVLILGWQLSEGWAGRKDTGEKGTNGRLV